MRDASLGAPGWELENLDGSSWTPSPGEPLDCDLKNDAEEKIDAINYSTTPQVGDALEQSMLWRSLEEESSRKVPGRPASEGLLQTTAKGLQSETEDEKGGVNSSPGCGSVAESAVSSPQSLLLGMGCRQLGSLIAELWTKLPKLNLKHCKAQSMGKGLFPLPTVHSPRLNCLMTHFQG